MQRIFVKVIAVVTVCFCSFATAQVSVPHTFTAGAPARAAEVNANFAALVAAINSLDSRVSRLEGVISASDVVGTYTLSSVENIVSRGQGFANTVVLAPTGTFTLNAGGAVSGTFIDRGHELNVSVSGGALNATATPRLTNSPLSGTTWALNGTTLTITFPDGPLILNGAAGGRIFVGSFHNADDGANGLSVLVRMP